MHERLINPDKEAVDRIFDFRRDFAANQQDHQHRDEGHAEQRSEEHRERFGERERLEQPALLGFQREHRDETHGDDQQGKKERAANTLRGFNDDVDALRRRGVAAVPFAKVLQMLVGVFHHDDGRVHHRADGDGDAAQRHDVRGQAEPMHRHEGKDDRNRQGDDGHQSGTDVPEENQADQRHDDAFLDQFFP